MKKSKIRLVLAVLPMMVLNACSHVNSEWDCPKQNGIGCINIEGADNLAIQKMNADKDHNASGQKVREIWVAPRTDKFGKSFDASVIRYIG